MTYYKNLKFWLFFYSTLITDATFKFSRFSNLKIANFTKLNIEQNCLEQIENKKNCFSGLFLLSTALPLV